MVANQSHWARARSTLFGFLNNKEVERFWNNDNHYLMILLVLTTSGMGAILSNPDIKTFDAGIGWTVFASLHVGSIHPTEEQWGVMMLAFAFYQVTSVWLLVSAAQEMRAGNAVDHPGQPCYRMARFVWALTCSFFVGLAFSAWASNPWGTFSLLLLIPSLLAFRVLVRVRHTIETAGK